MGYLEEDNCKKLMEGKTIDHVDSSSEHRIVIYFTDGTHVNIGIFCGDCNSPSYFFESD